MRQTKAKTKMLRFCFFFLLLLLSAGGSGPHGGYWFDNAQEDTDFGVGKPENVEFTKTVKTFDEDEDDLTSKKLGSYKLVFLRGNLVGMDHPVPAVAEALLSVHCSLPSSVALIVDEPVNKLEIIRVAAVGISEFGEAFSNSSTLSLSWELSSCNNLAYWDDDYNSKMTKSSWVRFLALRNESGLCTVGATVSGIDYSVGSESTLKDAIRLQLVSTLRVTPEFNLVFFNPNAKVNLPMTGGSCLWEAVVNNSRVAEVIRPLSGLQCSQIMLSPKGLGTTLVTVYDIGVSPPLSALALIKIADVDWIKIASGDEISIMEGSTHSIDLLTGLDDGMTFDSSQV